MWLHYNMKILTYPEVRGDLWHLQHQTGSQVLDVLQIVLHGVGQVHQVVQVDGIIFRSFELQVECLGLTYTKVTTIKITLKCHSGKYLMKSKRRSLIKMCSHQTGGWGSVSGAGSGWCPLASASLLPFCELSPFCSWASSVPRAGFRSLLHRSPFLSETAARHSGSTRSHPVSGSSKSSRTGRIKKGRSINFTSENQFSQLRLGDYKFKTESLCCKLGALWGKHGLLPTRKGLTKYTIELHNGKCRIQCLWNYARDKKSGYFGLCCFDFTKQDKICP